MTLPRCVLTAVLLPCAGPAATAAPRLWLEPSSTADAAKVPVVDGRFGLAEAPEYAQGRWFTLANWRGDGAPNGTLYMQVQDAIASPMPLHPRALFAGMRLPRRLHENESDDTGEVTIFLDADRVPLTPLRTGWPNADRRIVLTFRQAGGRDRPDAPVEVSATEAYATAAGGVATAEVTGANRMLRSAAIATDGEFLFLELRIDLPQPAFDDRRIGFALVYRDEGYATNRPVFTVPNTFEPATGARFAQKEGWAEIDLVEPASSALGIGIYNAGQMVFPVPAGDGGEGEPVDVARAIATRDLVCLTEVMHQDDRDDVYAYANRLRAQDPARPPFEEPVSGNPGDPPNNLILTSWYVVASQAMRFAAIRPGDARCTDASDEMSPTSRGSKGVVWARIAAPVCRATNLPAGRDGCLDENRRPERPLPSPDEWFDVFCTHTQAPYRYEGDEDSRDCQFMALEQFMTDRRSQPHLGRDGLDRPAILLGDLNQIGPRALPDNDVQSSSFRAWKDDGSDVFAATSFGAHDLKSQYERMRTTIGNAYPHPFDAASDDAIEDYDLSADTGGQGSWIGAERGSTVSGTTAGACTPGFPDLRLTPRVDYVMLIPPAADVYPAWAFRWDPAHPPRALVDKHTLGGGAEGCVSDHAEVYVHLRPLRVTDVPAFNPAKSHRLVYKVSYLADVYRSDGSDTDWYGSTSVRSPRGNVDRQWSDDETEDCLACDPRWTTVGAPFTGFETATVSARVMDWDAVSANDPYDADAAAGCREPSFSVAHASGDVHRTSCGGSPVFVGSLAASGVLRGPALWTVGNGDNGRNGFTGAPQDVAAVKHEIQMCEVGLRCE